MPTITGVVYDTETGRWTARKLRAAEIESLDAATITSGLIPHARISGLPYANLSLAGSIIANDIDSVDAAKIASGLLPHARISGLPYANLELTGEIQESDLVSGISIDIAEILKEPTYAAGEPISSYLAVYLMGSKEVGVAKANDAAKMPAIGAVTVALASGDTAAIWTQGRCDADPALISGQYQKVVFVQTDGQLRVSAPSASGNIQQRMGVVANDSQIMLYPSPIAVDIA